MAELANLTATVALLSAKVAEQEKTIVSTNAGVDELVHLVAGILVFFMQAGFAMLELVLSKTKIYKIFYLKI